ncbi:hypothetical protein OWR29_25405 [Actinoplanes sp. Pm04-4]|uniref:Uncharacterized protein n=1 Tax=Paractinoplanes pyxinae TaxID=2997416 RepID=A0ABT4B4C6_9ACTN|nr:hypothetical protein [Actinoplanes pyxinae]MCY1141349.1 hypothetical protein [Actinoplanes pyxinae]
MTASVIATLLGLLLLAVCAIQPLLYEVDHVAVTNRTRLDGTPLQATHVVPCACGALPGEACRCELPPVVCMPENPNITAYAMVGGRLRSVGVEWDAAAVTA